MAVLNELKTSHQQLKNKLANATDSKLKSLQDIDQQIVQLENTEPNFARLNGIFTALLNTVQEADVAPTSQAIAAFESANKSINMLSAKWLSIKEKLKSL